MTGAALITMILTMTIVSGFMGYFFWRILKSPPKAEPDSYSKE